MANSRPEMNEPSPLAKKLQIKPGKSWLFYDAPEDYLAMLEPIPKGTKTSFTPAGEFDGVQLFVKDSTGLTAGLKAIAPVLKPDTILWVTYPKKSSGIISDLEMTGSWDEPLKYGLRPVSAASINEMWTALRLRPVGQSKLSDSRNDKIQSNAYGAYINVDARLITLPAEMKNALEHSHDALAFFQTLSFSNKKEYIIWILSAKQEKTKLERLGKLIEKLSAGKKNPSDK
jgi:hypothetical protein